MESPIGCGLSGKEKVQKDEKYGGMVCTDHRGELRS